MKNINEILMKKLAYEERQALYNLANNKAIASEDTFGALQLVEDLTNINLTTKGFDAYSMGVVGLYTCCEYFKSLCKQFSELITNGDDGEMLANQHKMKVIIGSKPGQFKPKLVEIGLYDSAIIINDAITEYFIQLLNGSMRGNKDKQIYKYAVYATFADIYYSIRNLIEGKSYYDGIFMTEYKELPAEYEKQSKDLIKDFMEREMVPSVESAKAQLLYALDEGIKILKNIPLENAMEKAMEKDLEQKVNQLRETYYAEHGYPQGASNTPTNEESTSIEDLREIYYAEHGQPSSTDTGERRL